MTFTANDREVAARLEAWLTGVEHHGDRAAGSSALG